MLNGAVEPFAFDAEPLVVLFAFTTLNTGWSDSALALALLVFVEVDVPADVPAPNWTADEPLAATEVVLAVVAVAAAAIPAKASAAAVTPANRRCFICWFLNQGRD